MNQSKVINTLARDKRNNKRKEVEASSLLFDPTIGYQGQQSILSKAIENCQNCNNNQTRKVAVDECCLLSFTKQKNGSVSNDKACELIGECREFLRGKSDHERKFFLHEQLRKSITNFDEVLCPENETEVEILDKEEEKAKENLSKLLSEIFKVSKNKKSSFHGSSEALLLECRT
jgi:hypothetical protein